MRNVRDIRGLRRYILYGYVASILLLIFGVISFFLFFAPETVLVPPDQHEAYRSNTIWLFAGLFFIAFAAICIRAGRWSHHLIWILKDVKPETMKARIEIDEDSDSTSYCAIVSQQAGHMEGRVWRVNLYNPSRDVRRVVRRELTVKVYLEPKRNKPAVIETEHGLLWRMAGNGSVEELDAAESKH